MADEKKVFDDFPRVDCNDCEHYYTNQCDGVHKGSEKPCTSFLATRRVVLPEELKRCQRACESLEKRFLWLSISVLFLIISLGVHYFCG